MILLNNEDLIVTNYQFCRLDNYLNIAFVVTYYELCILLNLHTVFMIVIDFVNLIPFKGISIGMNLCEFDIEWILMKSVL